MAIAFDASDGPLTINGTGPGNFPHTCSGEDRLLVVAYRMGGGQGDRVTGITYDGVAMTFIGFANGSEGTGMYFLLNPSTGENTVSVSFSQSSFSQIASVSYTGVKQDSQPDASTTKVQTVQNITTTLTTVANNSWTVLIDKASTANISAGAGAFERKAIDGSAKIFDSNADITPAGETSMTINAVSSVNQSVVMASFAPVPVVSGGNPIFFSSGAVGVA